MTQDLAAALTDVRRAYRLLWAYQKRVTQCATFIRDRLGFEHAYVDYIFKSPKNDIEHRWSWDGLPFSLIGFISTKSGEEGGVTKCKGRQVPARLLLYVYVISDTGLSDRVWENDWKSEPDAGTFSPPEECCSQIELSLIALASGSPLLELPPKVLMGWIGEKEYWPAGDDFSVIKAEEGISIYKEYIDIAEIGDQDALVQRTDAFAARVQDTLSITLL